MATDCVQLGTSSGVKIGRQCRCTAVQRLDAQKRLPPLIKKVKSVAVARQTDGRDPFRHNRSLLHTS